MTLLSSFDLVQQPTPSADTDDESPSLPIDVGHRYHDGSRRLYWKDVSSEDHSISLPTNIAHVDMTVAPFLAEHIPAQYNPGGPETRTVIPPEEHEEPRTNTKFCYRHQPDLKCRRRANEPTMGQLQNELASLSQSDQQAISHVWSLFSAAPGKHRNLMLQGILAQCCFPQLSFLESNIKDLIKIDFLSALPPELGFRILCFLDPTSLCKAAQVSQTWRSLADDDVVWHRMCEQHIDRKCTKCGWGLPLLERKRLRIEKRQIQLRAIGRRSSLSSPVVPGITEESGIASEPLPNLPEAAMSASGLKRSSESNHLSFQPGKRPCLTSVRSDQDSDDSDSTLYPPRKRPWKDIYKDRFKVGTAWKYGRFSTKVFRGHTNGVMCLQFDENVMITGSYDTTVKIWDIHTGEEIRTLTGHTSGIRCLQFNENKLVTGSLDSTLKLWNWKTGQCLRTFPAHDDGILSLHFTDRYVASGSRDKTVRVWDSIRKETFLLRGPRGHTDWVNCVKIDEPSRTLFSASDDCTVRIWDLDTKDCIKIFKGHVGQVQQVLPMPVEFELEDRGPASCEKDDDAGSVHSLSRSPDHRRDSPPCKVPFWRNQPNRPAPPRYMLTGALDATIRLWDTHFNPPQQQGSESPSKSVFDILPTDPSTNSHTPRAQACVRTFFGHVEGIWSLSADHLRLISGGEDRMMKVWDPRTGKCERTFTGHHGPITCAWLSDSKVASGSEDCEVRMLCFGDN